MTSKILRVEKFSIEFKLYLYTKDLSNSAGLLVLLCDASVSPCMCFIGLCQFDNTEHRALYLKCRFNILNFMC